MAAALILTIAPPGQVDAKGALKSSFPLSTIAPLSGGGMDSLYGFGLTSVSGTSFLVQPGSASVPNGAVLYAARLATAATVSTAVSGAGGLDTGAITASTWYYVWIIVTEATGAVSAMISLSPTTPVMPNGYTLSRRVGSVFVQANSALAETLQTGTGPTKTYQWGAAAVGDILTGGNSTGRAAVSVTAGASPVAKTVDVVYFITSSSTGRAILYPSVSATIASAKLYAGVSPPATGVAPSAVTNGFIYYQVDSTLTGLTLYVSRWTEDL